MRALSIRQPYAELILRGIKTVEYRSRATRIVGQRFWIYASKKKVPVLSGRLPVWSGDLAVPGAELPGWMVELAEQVGMIEPGAGLPTGVIVGSAVIEKCEEVGEVGEVASSQLSVASGGARAVGPSLATGNSELATSLFRWHFAEVRRVKRLRRPRGHPQPVWFNPF